MPRKASADIMIIQARVPRDLLRRLERCLAGLNESQPGMQATLSAIIRMALARGVAELENELFGKARKE